MEPVRKPQPLRSKSFRYLAQATTPSPPSRDQCKYTTKRSPHSQSNEDIPRPIPPLPLSRTVGFEIGTSPLALRNSSISISSAASSGRHHNIEPSPWALQSNSSVLTRSSMAYSIVHQNRSSSRSNWDKDGSNAPNILDSRLVSTPSNSKVRRNRRRRSEKKESSHTGADMVPSPSPSLSRHSATRGSANRPSLFTNMPKPFWLQSAVSSDASEEEPSTGERKMTDCEALLVPTRPNLLASETLSQRSELEGLRGDDVLHATVPRTRRASAGVGEIKPSELRRLVMRHSGEAVFSPGASENTPLSLLRPKVSQPASLLRRGSAVHSPCMSPSLTALSAASIAQSLQTEKVTSGRHPTAAQVNCTTGNNDSVGAASPRKAAAKARLSMKPSVARQAIDRIASQEVSFTRTAHSPSPSPRRSSICVPREEYRGTDSSDRLADIFAQLVEKSQQLRAAQTSSSYGSGILTARTTVCGSPDSHSAAALTARLSDASTTDKTIKTTRELRNSDARLEWRDTSRASKSLASRRSGTRFAARSPGPSTTTTSIIDTSPHGPPQRPAGEPSIIDRVNQTKLQRGAGRRKPQARYSAPVSSESGHIVPTRTLLESESRPQAHRSQSTRRMRCCDTYTRTPEPFINVESKAQTLYQRGGQHIRHRHAVVGGGGHPIDRHESAEELSSDVHMSTESRIRRRDEATNRIHHVTEVGKAMPPIFT